MQVHVALPVKNFDLNIDKILENWEVFHAMSEPLLRLRAGSSG